MTAAIEKSATHRSAASIPGVVRASMLVEKEPDRSQVFSYPGVRGRLVEIVTTGGAPVLSVVSLLIGEAQREGLPVVWVTTGPSLFYPPDFARNGVSVESLPVIQAGSRDRAFRATEHLLRSGVFGLVVVDLETPGPVRLGKLGTLNRLASLHDVGVIFLNRSEDRNDVPLGSLISLRISVELEHPRAHRFLCRIRAIKDRLAVEGWTREVDFHGADGLY